MFAEHPVEMGMTGNMDAVRARLEAEPRYAELRAFLESLTDESFLAKPDYGDPWATGEDTGR